MGRQTARHNMVEFRQYEDHKKQVASEIREKRFWMGLTAKQVYDPIEMNPGQYTRIEAGELDGSRVKEYIDELFDRWKKKEIRKMEAKIEYFKAL